MSPLGFVNFLSSDTIADIIVDYLKEKGLACRGGSFGVIYPNGFEFVEVRSFNELADYFVWVLKTDPKETGFLVFHCETVVTPIGYLKKVVFLVRIKEEDTESGLTRIRIDNISLNFSEEIETETPKKEVEDFLDGVTGEFKWIMRVIVSVSYKMALAHYIRFREQFKKEKEE